MANLVKIAELLKNAPDQALMQELNNPNGAAPSYMVLSELQRRKKLRGSLMNQEPQSSVAEDLEAESAQAPQMGLGSFGQAAAPQQAPVGMASGGEVPRFNGETGSYVDYGGGYPVDASENTFWPSWEEIKRRTGYGRMLPPTPAAAPAAPAAVTPPAVAAVPAAARAAAPMAPAAQMPSTPAPARAKTPDTPAGSISPYLEELKGYRKDLAEQYQKQADIYQQQADKLESGKSKDVALALMQAGFGVMGGRSQYAAENIGQGAMPAIQQYAGMDRARQEQLQKLAMGQGALGIESLRARMEGAKSEAGLGLTEREVGAKERTARAHEISAGASASQAGAYRQAANEARIIGLREKAIEALSKDQNFQFLSPQQQEAAIQRRMQLIGIPGAGSAPAGPAIAGTYNPKTGRIE